MKKILITTLLIVGVTSIIAQTNSIEQSIKELQLKIEQSQKEEKLKWLDSLSKITKFKTELQYDSIVRKTIALAIELKAIDIELYHTSNLIEYQNYTLDKPKVGIQTFLNFNLKNESITNANLLAKLYLNGSNSYYEEKNYPKSIEYINKTLSIFENLNNNLEKSNCYFKLGIIYNKIQDYEKSIFYYFESLKIKEQLKDEKGVAASLEEIGRIYMITPDADIDLPKARLNINKAIEIYEKLNDEIGIISSLTNLGAINLKEGINHQNENKIHVAIKLFKEALKKSEKLGLESSQASLLGNIGPSLRMLDEYDESLEYLFKSLKIKKKLMNYTSAAHSCNDISETYIDMNNLPKAKEYALKAIKFAKGVSINQERYAYYLLSEIEYNLGEYKNSFNDLKQYHKLADSIFSQDKIASINEMQIKYETEKQDHRIKEQESDIALLNEQNMVKSQWLLFGGTGLISIFGFVLLSHSRNKAKHRQKLQELFSRNLLKSQEDERTRIARELHDSVGQQLTLIKKKSQNAFQPEITTLTHNALEDVRSISRGLYPAMLKQLGLTESIEQLIYELDEETDLFFSTEIDTIDAYFNEETSLNFYRFIQECLTNIIKHAEAKTVFISIKKVEKSIITLLNDNGKGFNTKNSEKLNSLGLKTIRERAKIMKGIYKIDSEPGQGTNIVLKIPI